MSFMRRVMLSSAASAALLCANTVLADVTVETKYGSVTVTDNVQSVVTLHEGALDVMSAINFPVAGSIATRGSEGISDYLADRQPDLELVGTARETNLEAVIKQRPDVILASNALSADQYQVLSKIAPTIVPQWGFDEPNAWRKEARLFGTVTGKTDAVDAALKAVDTRAAEIKARVEQQIPADEREAYIVRWMPQGPMIMAKDLFAGSVLTATGFETLDGGLIKAGRPHSNILSLENIGVIDQDWLFMATLNEDGQEAFDAAKQSSAFARLNVVQQDHVTTVDGQVWSSTSGPLAAQVMLDNIDALLDQHK
ncbi:putative siderophore-binding lipoprotein YfiY precursor [Marinomonas aquimarina]|uniref:Putative siderophore-binding lipoprotein YfiY n=1 Tax=Marinomonas aquimarina TaxID=295068 RepID=A0A1A8T8L0_9GAMM|nr:ABC transporter substrate-binding protein [Marinomonas aquimarina]SBS28229.1 putative siderophore-binding lipoprotein YfiY precursor [Marinomonas aquimarina]